MNKAIICFVSIIFVCSLSAFAQNKGQVTPSSEKQPNVTQSDSRPDTKGLGKY